MKKTLTVNEAAARLGKRPETVRRWISAGALPAVHEGGHVLIPAKALSTLSARTCENCGKKYTPSRPTRGGRYCSKACTWDAAYKRRKAQAEAKAQKKAVVVTPKTPAPKNERLEAVLRYVRR